MMKYFFVPVVIFISACFFTSCEEEVKPDKALLGEWAYVGDFDHRADYLCLVCPDFKYDSALYKLAFHQDRTISGKVNLLVMGGYYVTSETQKQGNGSLGKMKISRFRPVNKPFETEEDFLFQQKFTLTTSYDVSGQNPGKYDFLTLNYDDYKYLYFVRERK